MSTNTNLINSPKYLCFYDPNTVESTIDFFNRLEHFSKIDGIRVLLDFSALEDMTAAAAAYLFSIISAHHVYIDSYMYSVNLPKDKRMKDLFIISGLRDALRNGGENKLKKLWKTSDFVCGGSSDRTTFLKYLRKRMNVDTLPFKLGAAVRESLMNVSHHAYGGPSDLVPILWWCYTQLGEDKNGSYLSAVIVDRGEGIPPKIARNFPLYKYQTDSEKIKYAMQKSVTTTGEKGRGKGSANIKRPISENITSINDHVLVLSGNGQYNYRHDKKTEILIERTINSQWSLKGTVVEWRIYY